MKSAVHTVPDWVLSDGGILLASYDQGLWESDER